MKAAAGGPGSRARSTGVLGDPPLKSTKAGSMGGGESPGHIGEQGEIGSSRWMTGSRCWRGAELSPPPPAPKKLGSWEPPPEVILTVFFCLLLF